jgi:MYXO-CTERM domain-containing protein
MLVQGNGAPPIAVGFDPGLSLERGIPPLRLPALPQGDGTTRRGFDLAFGERSTAEPADAMLPLFGEPAIGDLDLDGTPDVVMAGGNPNAAASLAGGGRIPFLALLAAWSGANGRMLPGLPAVLEDLPVFAGQAIADINGDDYPEVLIGTGGYFVHAVDACGREPSDANNQWPKFTNGWITSAPAVGDVDGDRRLEVVVGTREGYLYAWHTPAEDTGVVQWESSHHDNQNTGNFALPLGQGVALRQKPPLDCSAPPTFSPRFEPGGGCDCSTSPAPASTLGWLLALAGGITLSARRLRRERHTRSNG